MRLRGGRTGKRAVISSGSSCPPEQAEPAARRRGRHAAVRRRDLVRRPGRRAGLERFGQVALPPPARRRWQRAGRRAPPGRRPAHRSGRARRCGAARRPGPARLVRPDPRAPRADRAHPAAGAAPRHPAPRRDGPGGGQPRAGPLRAGAARPSRPSTRCPAGSRRASRSCCSSCPGPPCCCSTSRPTTSTWTPPRRWSTGWRAFQGTVIAVTHDRWFARSFDRFLIFGADGVVHDRDEPVWDEAELVADSARRRSGRRRGVG